MIVDRHERDAVSRASDERRRQFLRLSRISAGCTMDELPEAAHVLSKLPYHDVCAVPAEIFFLRSVLGCRQAGAARIGVEERAIGVLVVFVSIAEKEFAERCQVAVLAAAILGARALVVP